MCPLNDDFPAAVAKKKVLFCIPGPLLDASGILFLNVLEQIPTIEITIKPCHSGFNQLEIEAYHLIFIVREIRGFFNELIQYAHGKGVKTAYAVDDNFLEVARMMKQEDFLSPKAINAVAIVDYLICTNQKLINYYRRINERVILWPVNVFAEELPSKPNTVAEEVVIGYFGNPRHQAFQEIAPALLNLLAARPNIKLLSAGFDLGCLNIPCRYIPFDSDYRRALSQIKDYRPHIMIAPNSSTYLKDIPNSNLDYKNIVKFLDATKLGAVLIATKLGPFKHFQIEHGLVTLENEAEEWFQALLKLTDDVAFRESLFTKARSYILENHEAIKIANQIKVQLEF